MAQIKMASVGDRLTAGFNAYACFFRACEFPIVEPTYDEENQLITLRINDDAELVLNRDDKKIYLDGEIVVDDWFLTGYATILVACSETAFYFKIRNDQGALQSGKMFHYLYEIVDIENEETGEIVPTAFDGYYFSASQYVPWENIRLYNIAISQRGENADDTEYTHKPMMDYKTPFKTLDYAYCHLIQGNIMTPIEDTNFMTCSSVMSDSIVSFDGINYYALDYNTLIEIDIDHSEDEDYEE